MPPDRQKTSYDAERLTRARQALAALGFSGPDAYLAELIPATEMAWADGEIQPHERALLEAYADQLVEVLNQEAGFPLFNVRRARERLSVLLAKRLLPYERQSALLALEVRAGSSSHGLAMRRRIFEWAEAVAAVAGRPTWDTRELFWLEAVHGALDGGQGIVSV